MNIHIDEEIGTVQAALKEQRGAPAAKNSTGFTSLKRKAIAIGCAAAVIMAASLAAAIIQLYTCTRQLQAIDQLEDVTGRLNTLLAGEGLYRG